MVGTEFAHLHPDGDDQSLHVMLPPDLVAEAIDAGWAEQHPVAPRGGIPRNAVMLYAPRDDHERAVVAGGQLGDRGVGHRAPRSARRNATGHRGLNRYATGAA